DSASDLRQWLAESMNTFSKFSVLIISQSKYFGCSQYTCNAIFKGWFTGENNWAAAWRTCKLLVRKFGTYEWHYFLSSTGLTHQSHLSYAPKDACVIDQKNRIILTNNLMVAISTQIHDNQ
ncbi:MAG: hypothetical protein AAFV25_17260, partial [Bacteroidota bacterium]